MTNGWQTLTAVGETESVTVAWVGVGSSVPRGFEAPGPMGVAVVTSAAKAERAVAKNEVKKTIEKLT